ncbi:TPA: hypothetical protein RRX76_005265, partial [Klebsiella pneumoniae]|nr:hypothetical protein [Klebsiella pneumoniae]
WGHTKKTRIKYELRYEMFDDREILSCAVILIIVTDLIIDEEITYPFDVSHYTGKQIDPINSFHELMHWLNLSLNELDRRILDAEIMMKVNGDFDPIYEYYTPDIIRICTKERIDNFLDYSFFPEKERKILIAQKKMAEDYRKSRKIN